MQPEPVSNEATETASATYLDRARATVGKLAAKMNRDLEQGGFGTGELAELRRLDADQGLASCTLTFWRVVVEELEAAKLLSKDAGTEALRPWITILRAMAELAGSHRPGGRLGSAMREAGVSEMRLVRLLRAEGRDLSEQVRPLAHQLRSAAVDVDLRELAELVLSGAGTSEAWSETVRRKIASAYFRTEKRSETSETNA